MTTLNLGVIDQAYTSGDKSTTTGQVAQILEDNYHVMRVFFELYEQKIADALARRMAALLDVAKVKEDQIFFDEVERMFRDYLDADEWSSIVPENRQIAAAQSGKSKRFKEMQNQQGSRPAFVDTGLYQAAFKAWIDTWA